MDKANSRKFSKSNLIIRNIKDSIEVSHESVRKRISQRDDPANEEVVFDLRVTKDHRHSGIPDDINNW